MREGVRAWITLEVNFLSWAGSETSATMGLMPLEFKDCLNDSPYFRQKLQMHEQELDHTNSSIKALIKEVKDLYQAARSECLCVCWCVCECLRVWERVIGVCD